MTRKWIWLTAACGALVLASGCDNSNPNANPGADAGGGGGNDAGVESDAGQTDDGGVEMDAGAEMDGGAVDMDGGAMDAGTEMDAGMMEMDAGTDAGVTPTNVCADVAKKKCDYMIRCRSEGASNQGRANDATDSAERAACEAREADLACRIGAAGWAKGRATLDQTKYQACIDATYPANTCARDLNDVIVKCLNAPYVTGTTPNGSLCVGDSECSNGFCAKTGANTCGVCTAFVATGQQCPNGNECDKTTAFCQQGFQKTCTAYTALGQGCFTDAQCGPGNVCHVRANSTFQRECAVGVAKGGACTGGKFDCARHPDPTLQNGDVPELICSSQNGTGTCIDVQSAPGGACSTGERFTATNMARGPLCNETEFCITQTGSCTPRVAAGSTCNATDVCAFGTYCDNGQGGTNTCVAYKGAGQGCTGNNQCKNLLSCQGATCQAGVALIGQPCNAMQPCAEGYCDSGTNTCTALKADGSACTAAGQCDSNACVNGMCAAACWQ